MATIPVMGVVAIAVFALLHITPGDPAVIIAGDYATSDDVARIRAKLGLDQPFVTQVGIWLGRIVRGDLGTSIFSGLPVSTLIHQRTEATVGLTITQRFHRAGKNRSISSPVQPNFLVSTPATSSMMGFETYRLKPWL